MALARCEWCEVDLPLLVRSHARTCSPRCRKALSRADVPAELRKLPRWVSHTPEKRPVTTKGKPASSTNPETWADYAEVRSLPRKGFVLNGDGIVCLDLDHCLVDGKPTAAAAVLLAQLPRTYIEVSQSGEGLHVFGFGSWEGSGRKFQRDGVNIEAYRTGRYIAVTGKTFRGSSPRLADLSRVLGDLLT